MMKGICPDLDPTKHEFRSNSSIKRILQTAKGAHILKRSPNPISWVAKKDNLGEFAVPGLHTRCDRNASFIGKGRGYIVDVTTFYTQKTQFFGVIDDTRVPVLQS